MAVSDTPTLQPIAGRTTLRSYVGNVWERREFIATMPKHELHAENLDTALGNFWLLLNPLLLSAIYWLVFGELIGADRGVDNFIPFLVAGVMVYRLWAGGAAGGARIMWRHRGLVRSLYFPRAVLPISASLTEILTFLPGAAILLIVAVVTGETPDWQWLLFPVAILLVAMFMTGTMFITARLGSKYRDLSTLLPHITRLGLYGSGVLYDPEMFTQDRWALLVFDVNPIYQFLTLTRWCIIDIEVNWWFWITAPAYAVVMLTAGFVYFWRGETTYGATT